MNSIISFITLALVMYVIYQLQSSNRTSRRQGIILDTCALIDGRIEALITTGFISDAIIVPNFVLKELQMLADGADNQKRARARFGLEVSERLSKMSSIDFKVDSTKVSSKLTDDMLIELSKKRQARLCTTDYNLQKVASSNGIVVVNVNELAHLLRPSLLPGEEYEVKIIQKGESRQQGVGYLDDGSMVVIENGSKYINTKQIVVIERSLQTVAGKMSFAHLKDKKLRRN